MANRLTAPVSFPEYQACHLCPRNCGVNRAAGERGICRETATLRIAWSGLHHGEEPPISGRHGSGAIFLAACPCHCFYCQNWQISAGGEAITARATVITSAGLHAEARRLAALGTHNLNFVTPEHFWPHIRALAEELHAENVPLPLILNSSGFTRPELIPAYADSADIFLPDYKFADPLLAAAVMNAPDYPETALNALTAMVRAKGFLAPFDPTGTTPACEGVLVRHLVLPGHVQNSLDALTRLRDTFGRLLPLSVMSQYTPIPATQNRPPFNRRLTSAEYQQVLDHIEHLGFEHVFIQPLAADSTPDPYLPDFTTPTPFGS